MRGFRGKATLTVKAARAALTETEDALETARATEAALETAKEEAERELFYAKRALEERIAAVVRSEPPRRLAEDCLAAQRVFADKIKVLDFLAGRGMLPDELQRCATSRIGPTPSPLGLGRRRSRRSKPIPKLCCRNEKVRIAMTTHRSCA
jgi:hypothetical protein